MSRSHASPLRTSWLVASRGYLQPADVGFPTLNPTRSFDTELKKSVGEAARGEKALINIYSTLAACTDSRRSAGGIIAFLRVADNRF